MDQPEIRNEIFAGTKFSSAAFVAVLKNVQCAAIGSVSYCKV